MQRQQAEQPAGDNDNLRGRPGRLEHRAHRSLPQPFSHVVQGGDPAPPVVPACVVGPEIGLHPVGDELGRQAGQRNMLDACALDNQRQAAGVGRGGVDQRVIASRLGHVLECGSREERLETGELTDLLDRRVKLRPRLADRLRQRHGPVRAGGSHQRSVPVSQRPINYSAAPVHFDCSRSNAAWSSYASVLQCMARIWPYSDASKASIDARLDSAGRLHRC